MIGTANAAAVRGFGTEVRGFTVKEVALVLDISVKTVETHRANLMERLDMHNVPRLVHYAIRAGLISVEE